ncbi:MAG: nucleotide sugar dehydrogenase [Acidimicrobiales bacterium]|nr:nucleotide sugar dehydrogenase [Acidimicrobiales bacterium]
MADQRVVVIGQGYVGLPVAMRAVAVGFDVVGYDVAHERIDALAAGRSYVEDITAAELQAALGSGRYLPTTLDTDCKDFDFAVVSVPTPLREGEPDLSYVEAAARSLGRFVRPGCTVILESTTYPGTTEELFGPLLAEHTGLTPGSDFALGYSPERIDPGNRTHNLVNTPKVVSGVDTHSLERVQWFFDQLCDDTVAVPSPREAELTKLLENTFRHVNIALVNELAMFANDLGIDVWSAIDAASTKPFGYMRFTPGPGVGGHCLPIDPSYLSWQVRRSLGTTFRFVELANDVNSHMPDYVVRRVQAAFNDRSLPVNGQNILLLGLAYKRNTSDARESPSLEIAEQLRQLGANVWVHDNHVADEQLPAGSIRRDLTAEVLAAADGVVMLVAHDDIDTDLVAREADWVLDCQAVLPACESVELL